MGLKNETVCLKSNFNHWKKMFENEKKELVKLFVKEDVIIEHVGSTSVEGLLAKPIVDIAIGVGDFKSVEKYINLLQEIYTIKNNDENGEILLIKENNLETFYLIHILDRNSDRFKNMLKFRDILRNNPDVLKEYQELKKHLSVMYPNDRKMYTKSKNDFIQEVLKNH